MSFHLRTMPFCSCGNTIFPLLRIALITFLGISFILGWDNIFVISTLALNNNMSNNKTKIKNCNFCHQPKDTIEAILRNCKPIFKIWENFEKFLMHNDIAKIKLNKDMILYNLIVILTLLCQY